MKQPRNKKKTKPKTFKNYSQSEKTNFNVNIDLPEELEEIKPNNVVLNDVPYGVLLSGGLDSSLVAGIMAKQIKELNQNILYTYICLS